MNMSQTPSEWKQRFGGITAVVTEPEVTTFHLKNTASPVSVRDIVLRFTQSWFDSVSGNLARARS